MAISVTDCPAICLNLKNQLSYKKFQNTDTVKLYDFFIRLKRIMPPVTV